MRGRRRFGATIAGVLGALGMLAGCGLPTDDAPREIAREAIPDLTSTTVPVEVPNGDSTVTIYFVADEQLAPVERQVQAELGEDAAIELLLAGPSEDDATDNLTTSIPPGTSVLGTQLDQGLLTIDLSEEMGNVGGTNAKVAFAQLVFTALERPGVSRVSFRTEGAPIDAPTDDGDLSVVTAGNYERPLRPNQ